MVWMMHVASDDVPQHYPLEETVFGLFLVVGRHCTRHPKGVSISHTLACVLHILVAFLCFFSLIYENTQVFLILQDINYKTITKGPKSPLILVTVFYIQMVL